ncbi:MAG TPA: TonB-dependent receptor plug domain-containing protein [Bacteroidia bacterium]|nr:TonB-dependent receptor plug domain-containing protein [Bacteroidia bacterium]
MFRTKYSLVVVFLLVCLFCFPQQKGDTLLLHEVNVTDYRIKKSAENFVQLKIDSAAQSAFLTSNLSQLLIQQNGVMVKAYGPGNIASLSIRGSTAQQTAVIWNGMNINNPMLGQADISLLPVGFFNSMSIQKGALSGYWGSGAMAGVLNLQSNPQQINGLMVQASTSYSSLQNNVQWASVNFSDGKLFSSTKLLVDYSQNKYQYYKNTDTSLVKQTQQHAQINQLALLQDFLYNIKSNQQFGLHIWLQNVDRQMPNTISALQQDAKQIDKTFRTMLDWKVSEKKTTFTTKLAFFNEALIYNNLTDAIYDNSNFKTFALDADLQYKADKRFFISGGTSNMLSLGNSPNYVTQKQLLRDALFENISWNSKRDLFIVNVYARQELFNSITFVPTAGATTTLNIFSWLAWKMNVGTVYRYPTLNDLYWNPGGNPNLKPEQGHSEETSLLVKHQKNNVSVSFTGTIFSRDIHNWIMWLPGKDGNWSPVNILHVWSRGIETNTELMYKSNKFKTSLNVLTNYILSTALPANNNQYTQMLYTPMYSGSAILSVGYKKWMLRAAYTYTGYRYLSSDNYNYLMPYTLLDIRAARTFTCKTFLLNVFAEVNNLLNENYQSITQYGMPLRNYRAGLIIQYHKPIKNNHT